MDFFLIVISVVWNHRRQRFLGTTWLKMVENDEIMELWGAVEEEGTKFVAQSASQMDSPLPYYRFLILTI